MPSDGLNARLEPAPPNTYDPQKVTPTLSVTANINSACAHEIDVHVSASPTTGVILEYAESTSSPWKPIKSGTVLRIPSGTAIQINSSDLYEVTGSPGNVLVARARPDVGYYGPTMLSVVGGLGVRKPSMIPTSLNGWRLDVHQNSPGHLSFRVRVRLGGTTVGALYQSTFSLLSPQVTLLLYPALPTITAGATDPAGDNIQLPATPMVLQSAGEPYYEATIEAVVDESVTDWYGWPQVDVSSTDCILSQVSGLKPYAVTGGLTYPMALKAGTY